VASKWSGPAGLCAAAVLFAPIALSSGGTAYASIRPALANLSGNAYFPLVVGATWKYRDVGGPTAGSTMIIHVASAHQTSSGEVVNVNNSVGAAAVTEQYIIGANGAIEIEVATGSGSTKATVSGSGTYFIPSASQIGSCHPCHFAANFTTTASGFSMREHLAETATSAGVKTVSVPAGTFHAEKLQMLLEITSSAPVASSASTVNYAVYLVKNVGMVETGAGSVSMSVMGHHFGTAIGAAELLSYTP
jgi:hypothetical protein